MMGRAGETISDPATTKPKRPDDEYGAILRKVFRRGSNQTSTYDRDTLARHRPFIYAGTIIGGGPGACLMRSVTDKQPTPACRDACLS
jgi:hypothetical protein